MPFDLLRIDERLIHGQVLVGWGARLGIDFYLVVDDALAGSEWEQEIYASALPEGQVEFLTVEDAIARWPALAGRTDRGALLTRGVDEMLALSDAGCLEGRRINLGGVHDGAGRRKLLDYLYLSEAELEDLERIASRAASVTARDLPTSPEVSLEQLVAR